MKEHLYTIGEVAKITGLTIKALRFYEKIGLLVPHNIDEFTKYRYYHFNQFMYMDIIIAARNMGISPNDLVPLLKAGDSENLVKLLSKHKDITRHRIEELQLTLEGIEGIQSTLTASRLAIDKRGIYKKYIKKRHAITFPFNNDSNREQLILNLSQLEISAVKRGLINTYESGVLFENRDGDFFPSYLFTGLAKAADVPDYIQISEGEYICVNYDEKTAQKKMEDLGKYLRMNGIEPEALLQVELLGDLFYKGNVFFELQARLPG